MGNSVFDPDDLRNNAIGQVTKFYSQSAWIDPKSEDQLHALTKLIGVSRVAGFPDLHVGKYGPIGCAVLADRIYPHLIGNDIGCGMALFEMDQEIRKLKLDKSEKRLRRLAEPSPFQPAEMLEEYGLDPTLYSNALGTLGGGNHFCEIQSVQWANPETGFDTRRCYLLVHSGSRTLGNDTYDTFANMEFVDEQTDAYLNAHDIALRWAKLNRWMIAHHVGRLLGVDVRLIVDAPHNMVTPQDGGFLHRKGAAATTQPMIPLAGSRATPSFVMAPMSFSQNALDSMSHGAGRKYDRRSMQARVGRKKSELHKLTRSALGGRIICEDKTLLVEEAPLAYKSAIAVAEDLEAAKIAKRVAMMHPILTYKTAKEGKR